MEYLDSDNGKLIAMEKNGANNGHDGSDNFENGYNGKDCIIKHQYFYGLGFQIECIIFI